MSTAIQPTVVISLDLELAWGSFDCEYGPELLERARWTHAHGVKTILEQLCRNGLSATWAVVGIVALEQLPPDLALEEVHYTHFPHPWLHHVPRGRSEAEAPEWFGASLVRQIQQTRPKQEIGFHSLSHVVFGDPGTSRTRARQEFRACAAIAHAIGCEADSFVFPRNSIGHLDELRHAGFRCYRGPDLLPISCSGSKTRSWVSLVSDLLALTPRTVIPTECDGLVNIPGSLMIRHAGGWRRFIPDGCRARRLSAGLRKVSNEGGVFHVWLHPENLHAGRPRIETVLADFLDELGAAVASGRVRCLPMGSLARELSERSSPVQARSPQTVEGVLVS